MAVIQCRYFSGYKPCGLNSICDENCTSQSKVQSRILLIHLGALGAVVRSTGLLKLIHKKHPQAHLTWVTQRPAHHLLTHNNLIDRVLTTENTDLLKLKSLKFDVAYVVDKSLEASGVLSFTHAQKIYGFIADPLTGAILPANSSAQELWQIGLNDDLKFYKNKKSELQLTIEALELSDKAIAEDYYLPLAASEQVEVAYRKSVWSGNGNRKILGINTGCSSFLPAKKLTVENHRELIKKFAERQDVQVVLLGGVEDRQRNLQIAEGLRVVQSDTQSGLRDGLISVAACDVIFTGDSLGMHMSISQQVSTVAWFGPSCAHEIDFFGRGEAILTTATCSPCWKRSCQKTVMCYDLLDLVDVQQRLNRRLSSCQILQTKKSSMLDLS
ncbi:MAG: glycosyltransferase family 9 protein [Bdellovibrionota bacterium]